MKVLSRFTEPRFAWPQGGGYIQKPHECRLRVADSSDGADAPSVWAATAIAPPLAPALMDSVAVDVLIVGAGYTGLSTALHLAQKGVSVCVLDAQQPGWGASGRNGGQVNPTLKHDPDELVRMLGAERAEPLIQAVSRSADLVFDLIDQHSIDCQPVRSGWLQLGYSPLAVQAMHDRAAQWQKRGVQVEFLNRVQVAERVGSESFEGGWLDGRAGAIQPLSFARGLTAAALRLGVRIHGESRVATLERRGLKWVARTQAGLQVTADQVVLATNGYTDGLWPGLSRTVLAANSAIVATEPLGEKGASILRRGEAASTSQRLLLYFRKDAQGRLLLGGRGHFADPRGAGDFAHLERAVALHFPQLRNVRFDYRWAGRIAVTRDFMPHLHQPAPGVTVALGYNGRGIALATSMGRDVATLLTQGQANPGAFPITPIRPIPMHGLQRFYVAAGVAWYSLLDKLSR